MTKIGIWLIMIPNIIPALVTNEEESKGGMPDISEPIPKINPTVCISTEYLFCI